MFNKLLNYFKTFIRSSSTIVEKPVEVSRFIKVTHLGITVGDTLDIVIRLSKEIRLGNPIIIPSLTKTDDILYFAIEESEDKTISDIHLLKDSLNNLMIYIDGLAGKTYYRRYKIELDLLYPILLKEYLYLIDELN